MLQLSIALSDNLDLAGQIAPVIDEWATGRYRELLLHVYSGLGDEGHTVRVVRSLKRCLPDAKVVGTMSAGEISCGHLIERGVLVGAMLFERSEVCVLRYDDLCGNEADRGREMCADVCGIADARAIEMLLPGSGIDAYLLFEELNACPEDLVVFGGFSGGPSLNSPLHFVFDDTGILYDSLFAVVFCGKDLHVDADKVTGWEPLGLPFKVTKASGSRLYELDGRPASDVYERFLNIDRDRQDNAQEGYTFPFLIRRNGEEWLRSTVHIEEDGSLSLHGHVFEDTEITLSYGNPDTIIRLVNARLEALCAFEPEAILFFSCIVRRAFWESCVDMEVEPFARLCNATGFHTWGEVYRNPRNHRIGVHNVTFLTVGLREGDATGRAAAPVRVDDTALRGPVAQLRRLTSMVYTCMGELQRANAEMSALNRRLTIMAEHDALTGIYNRGCIERLILDAIADSEATGAPVGLIMCDIDHFKRVNDEFGHQAGDLVLREFAKMLSDEASRHAGSAVGRWGGEEFFVVLPATDADKTYEAAEAIRMRFSSVSFPEVGRVTVSLGVVTTTGACDPRRLFASVDDALYRAKEGGRNRTVRA